MRLIIILSFYLIPFFSNGQTRTITGKVIDENFETLPEVRIQNIDTVRLGSTDINGKFKIEISLETDQLLLSGIGIEWTSIELTANCDNLEIIMHYDGTYDFMTIGRINRIRYRRFKDLQNKHRLALEKGIFTSDVPCLTYIFNKY